MNIFEKIDEWWFETFTIKIINRWVKKQTAAFIYDLYDYKHILETKAENERKKEQIKRGEFCTCGEYRWHHDDWECPFCGAERFSYKKTE